MGGFHDIALPSNRTFGLFFAGIFVALGLYQAVFPGRLGWALALFALAALLVVLAFVRPAALLPLNRAWMFLGYLLSKITGPIVLGLIFFALITPIAVFGRLFGRDELRLRPVARGSHWRERTPPGPEPGSFRNQF